MLLATIKSMSRASLEASNNRERVQGWRHSMETIGSAEEEQHAALNPVPQNDSWFPRTFGGKCWKSQDKVLWRSCMHGASSAVRGMSAEANWTPRFCSPDPSKYSKLSESFQLSYSGLRQLFTAKTTSNDQNITSIAIAQQLSPQQASPHQTFQPSNQLDKSPHFTTQCRKEAAYAATSSMNTLANPP
jgi:hypothetical protein